MPRAVIFDLDETLIDSRAAWAYTLEQAILASGGERVDARPLQAAYRRRPWRHALGVLLEDATLIARCEAACEEIAKRSALKRLLVHDGIGMALDRLRELSIEMGVVSRLEHREALQQIESAGLDRFLGVLVPTPSGQPWDAALRFGEATGYLKSPHAVSAFVSGDSRDLDAVAAGAVTTIGAAWANAELSHHHLVESPAELRPALRAAFAARA